MERSKNADTEDLQQYIRNVEATAKRILKDQQKRSKEAALREKIKRREHAVKEDSSDTSHISREVLNKAYSSSNQIIKAPDDDIEYRKYIEHSLPILQIESPKKNVVSLNQTQPSSPSKHLPKLSKTPTKKAKRSSKVQAKLMQSPLNPKLRRCKSMEDFENSSVETQVNDAMKFLKSSGKYHSFRADHATDIRSCNACMMKLPSQSSCNHTHLRSVNGYMEKTVEAQGPSSWSSDDIRIKYRYEEERTRAWEASVKLIERAKELEENSNQVVATPVIDRHPLHQALENLIESLNHELRSLSRKRNMMKMFVLDVHRVWLTNLDHIDARSDPTLDTTTTNGLQGRRDMQAIREGRSQIQSVSFECSISKSIDMATTAPKFVEPKIKGEIVDIQQHLKKLKLTKAKNTSDFKSLSLSICGRSQLVNQVPGTVHIGKCGLWWSFPFDVMEHTQACAMFLRDEELSSAKTILVLLSLALDTPCVAPKLFAWIIQACESPLNIDISQVQKAPKLISFKESYLETPLISILDTSLPDTILIFNAASEEGDYISNDGVDIPGNQRHIDELNSFFFRKKLTINLIKPNFEYTSQAYGISQNAAIPNNPGMTGRFTWHSEQQCVEQLCRNRTPKDYHYMVVNEINVGGNGTAYHTLHMLYESIASIQVTGLINFLAEEKKKIAEVNRLAQLHEVEAKIEAGRLALEARRAEKIRLLRESEMKKDRNKQALQGSRAIKNANIEEWEERVNNSRLSHQWNNWQERIDGETGFRFYSSSNPDVINKYSWEPPDGWPDELQDQVKKAEGTGESSSNDDESSNANGDENMKVKEEFINTQIEDLGKKLADNESFLFLIKKKLGLDRDEEDKQTHLKEVEKWETDSSSVSDSDEDQNDNDLDEMETEFNQKLSKITKLKIDSKNMKNMSKNGEGWKRLKRSSLPLDFASKVSNRKVEPPREKYINSMNLPMVAGMIDPSVSSHYIQNEYFPALKAQFVTDITADTERMLRQNKNAVVEDNQEFKENYQTIVQEEAERESKIQAETNAIMYTRNNNLEMLEKLLDDGCGINTADGNGNSLFILACQQGNKRIAKFLLRRGAEINAQNISGNSGLHYCFEYKNTELANYLISKGASDTITNGEGLTCYEGLSRDNLEAI